MQKTAKSPRIVRVKARVVQYSPNTLPRQRIFQSQRLKRALRIGFTSLVAGLIGRTVVLFAVGDTTGGIGGAILIVLLIALRISITIAHKVHRTRRLRRLENSIDDADFTIDMLDVFRLTSGASDGRLPPSVASVIDDDPFMKGSWDEMHQDIQQLYQVLGPPPMRTLTAAPHA
jgi:hypothetical protein